MIWGRSPVPREAQVTLIRKIKVPAGSAVLCAVCLDVGLGDFMVVPEVHLLSDTFLMPYTYHTSGDSTAVCLINASDKDVVLAAESAMGRAVEADLHEPVPFLSRTVCDLAKVAQTHEVPAHLQDLLERSSEEQRSQLAELLTEFQDVFARSEFDYGDFTALVHETPPPTCEGKNAEDPSFFRWGGGGSL